MNNAVRLKGIRDGLLVSLSHSQWGEQEKALLSYIDARPTFFAGARLAMDVGQAVWRVKELSALRDALSQRQIYLWAVLSESPVTEKTAQLLGLATRLSTRTGPQRRPTRPPAEEPNVHWVQKTVRSGVRIEAEGHLVLIGDVNPGGEVAAAGNILIWGRLRGMAHAGANGDAGAVIRALELRPQQVRIAQVAATEIRSSGPAQVVLEKGIIRVQSLNSQEFKVNHER